MVKISKKIELKKQTIKRKQLRKTRKINKKIVGGDGKLRQFRQYIGNKRREFRTFRKNTSEKVKKTFRKIKESAKNKVFKPIGRRFGIIRKSEETTDSILLDYYNTDLGKRLYKYLYDYYIENSSEIIPISNTGLGLIERIFLKIKELIPIPNPIPNPILNSIPNSIANDDNIKIIFMKTYLDTIFSDDKLYREKLISLQEKQKEKRVNNDVFIKSDKSSPLISTNFGGYIATFLNDFDLTPSKLTEKLQRAEENTRLAAEAEAAANAQRAVNAETEAEAKAAANAQRSANALRAAKAKRAEQRAQIEEEAKVKAEAEEKARVAVRTKLSAAMRASAVPFSSNPEKIEKFIQNETAREVNQTRKMISPNKKNEQQRQLNPTHLPQNLNHNNFETYDDTTNKKLFKHILLVIYEPFSSYKIKRKIDKYLQEESQEYKERLISIFHSKIDKDNFTEENVNKVSAYINLFIDEYMNKLFNNILNIKTIEKELKDEIDNLLDIFPNYPYFIEEFFKSKLNTGDPFPNITSINLPYVLDYINKFNKFKIESLYGNVHRSVPSPVPRAEAQISSLYNLPSAEENKNAYALPPPIPPQTYKRPLPPPPEQGNGNENDYNHLPPLKQNPLVTGGMKTKTRNKKNKTKLKHKHNNKK